MSFSCFFIYKNRLNNKKEKIKNEIICDFKDFINLFLTSTITGDESKRAFINAYNEFKTISQSKRFMSVLDVSYNKVNYLSDFMDGLLYIKESFDLDEINKFYDSINIAYKTTGDINSIIQDSVSLITNKIETQKEIENIYHEKKYEMMIMLFIPILIYAFLSFTANEFLNPIYNSIIGYIVITICFALLILAFLLGEKIMENDIE